MWERWFHTLLYLSVHTSTVIEQERAMEARTRQPVLHPVIRADIEAFPKKLLNHVETVVKLSLPSNEGTYVRGIIGGSN